MRRRKALEAELLVKVKNQEANLNNDICPLDADQATTFRSCCVALSKDSVKLPKSSRYRLVSFQKILRRVHLSLGPEILFLCVLATSVTALSKLNGDILIPKLRRWMETITIKQGLKDVVQKLWKDNNVTKLLEDTTATELLEDTTATELLDDAGALRSDANRSSIKDSASDHYLQGGLSASAGTTPFAFV